MCQDEDRLIIDELPNCPGGAPQLPGCCSKSSPSVQPPQDESVELVKELLAELRRHQSELVSFAARVVFAPPLRQCLSWTARRWPGFVNLLPNNQVERLNEIQQRIEREKDSHTKFLLRVEWMEEKQRSVELLKKVHPFPNSLPPASNRQT